MTCRKRISIWYIIRLKGPRQAKHRMPHIHFCDLTPKLPLPCDTAQLGHLRHAHRSHPSSSYDSIGARRAHHRKAFDRKFPILRANTPSRRFVDIGSHRDEDLSPSNGTPHPLLQIPSNSRSKLPRLRKPRLQIPQLIPPPRISCLLILKSIITRLYALKLH